MLVLKLTDGNGKDKIVELADRGVFAVGSNDCPILVADETVSSRHAQFICDGVYWFVEDLKSTNGTFVNDKRIKTKMALGRGDVIRMGTAIFRVGRTTSKSGEPVPVDAGEIDIEDRLKLTLLVISGKQRGDSFDVSYDHPAPIGRASKVVPIEDPKASRRHAALIPKGGKWFIRDLDSPNSTFVNGKGITSTTELDQGDLIEIGNTQIQVTHIPDEEMVALRVEVEQIPVSPKDRSAETFVADFEDSYEGDLPSAEDTQLGTVDFDEEFPDPFADFRAKIALKNGNEGPEHIDGDEGMLPAVGEELLQQWLEAPELEALEGNVPEAEQKLEDEPETEYDDGSDDEYEDDSEDEYEEDLDEEDSEEEFEDEVEQEAPLSLKEKLLEKAIPIDQIDQEDQDEQDEQENPDAFETLDGTLEEIEPKPPQEQEEPEEPEAPEEVAQEEPEEEVGEPIEEMPLELATPQIAGPADEQALRSPGDLAFEAAPEPPPAPAPQPPAAPVLEEPVNKVLAKRQEVLATFISRSMHRLSKNDVAVWLALFHESDNEFKASIGQTKLSKHVGISPSTVGTSIQRLEDAGLVTVLYQGGLGRGNSRYSVHGKKQVTLTARPKPKPRTPNTPS